MRLVRDVDATCVSGPSCPNRVSIGTRNSTMLVQTHQPAPQKQSALTMLPCSFVDQAFQQFIVGEGGRHTCTSTSNPIVITPLSPSAQEALVDESESRGIGRRHRALGTAAERGHSTHRTLVTLLHPRTCPVPLGIGISTH